MKDSRAKDALVIGDDSTVEEYYQKEYMTGTQTAPEEHERLDRMGLNAPQEFYDDFWDGVYEVMGALVKERNEKINRKWGSVDGWLVEGSGMGWRGQRGYEFIDISTYGREARAIGFDFLNQILPQTDNTFYVYDFENGNGFVILNRNHDVPVNPERYETLSLDYMIDNGLWWGINSSEGDIIEAIWEQVQYEWEQFLNEELAARNDAGEKIGGMLAVLDIEFDSFFLKFLAQYKLKPENRAEMLVIRDDLAGFFDKHYATEIGEAWVEFLHDVEPKSFEGDLMEFLEGYGLTPADVEDHIKERLRGIQVDLTNEQHRKMDR